MPGDETAVRELAYRLWEARGRRHGDAEQDWLAAESQLAGGELASGDIAAGARPADRPASEVAARDLPGHDLAAHDVPGSELAAHDVPGGESRAPPGSELVARDLPGNGLSARDNSAIDPPAGAKRPAAGARPAQPKGSPPRRRARTSGNSNSADH